MIRPVSCRAEETDAETPSMISRRFIADAVKRFCIALPLSIGSLRQRIVNEERVTVDDTAWVNSTESIRPPPGRSRPVVDHDTRHPGGIPSTVDK